MQHHNTNCLRRRWRHALLGLGAFGAFAQPSVSTAQLASRDHADSAHADKPAPPRLFTYKDAVLAAGFAGATIAMIPLDRRIALRLQDSATQANRFLNQNSHRLEVLTSPGALIIGGAFYAVGKIGHFDRLADLGWHGTEAVLFAEGLTFMVKGVVGRSRPYITGGHDPDVFKVGRGFTSTDYASFPSGHTSTAFAVAGAVTNETTKWWPKSTWIIGPIMYAGATSVGLSRMYHSKHWASDVVLGAAIGTFSGRKVWQFTHDHPDNRFDRILLHTSAVPDGHGGALLAMSFPVGW